MNNTDIKKIMTVKGQKYHTNYTSTTIEVKYRELIKTIKKELEKEGYFLANYLILNFILSQVDFMAVKDHLIAFLEDFKAKCEDLEP